MEECLRFGRAPHAVPGPADTHPREPRLLEESRSTPLELGRGLAGTFRAYTELQEAREQIMGSLPRAFVMLFFFFMRTPGSTIIIFFLSRDR